MVVIITLLVIIVLVVRKPLVRYYRSNVSAKIEETNKQHNQEIQDFRTEIRVAYERGGITEEEVRGFPDLLEGLDRLKGALMAMRYITRRSNYYFEILIFTSRKWGLSIFEIECTAE